MHVYQKSAAMRGGRANLKENPELVIYAGSGLRG
jgi:hypothetical protein